MRRAIASIDPDAWVRIEYPRAVLDPETGELVSAAEVAEVSYLAFTSHRTPVTGRLIVRRIPERNTKKLAHAAQQGLFEVWRYHAIFTNNPAPLVQAESQHRGHAIVEQVIANLKAGPLAHLPSGQFQANAAWLVAATIAFNLTAPSASQPAARSPAPKPRPCAPGSSTSPPECPAPGCQRSGNSPA